MKNRSGEPTNGIDYETGEMHADRSRTDFAGSRSRKAARGVAKPSAEMGTGGDRRRGVAEMKAGWASRGGAMSKRTNPGRSVPAHAAIGLEPKPPPIIVLYDDIVAPEDLDFFDRPRDMPSAVYGQYPRALIAKLLPWLRCERREILHVCSGSLPPGEGIRVDMRPEARPDILADGRALPIADGTIAAVLIDPPYTAHYARELYGVEYPRPSHLLREAARVVRPGGRIGLVHYITAKPVPGLRFVKAFGLSTGFDMPMRAVSIYERSHAELHLEAP